MTTVVDKKYQKVTLLDSESKIKIKSKKNYNVHKILAQAIENILLNIFDTNEKN